MALSCSSKSVDCDLICLLECYKVSLKLFSKCCIFIQLNPKIQIDTQPTLRPNLSHSHFRHNVSHPHNLHHCNPHTHLHHHHHHHLQQHPLLSRQVSDPHEVVSRLQNRLKLMASAETMSLSSDRGSEGPEHFHNSQTDLQSPPMSPHVEINQEQVHPHEKVVHQVNFSIVDLSYLLANFSTVSNRPFLEKYCFDC